MQLLKDFIKRFLREEKGFQSVEWSYLFFVSLIIITLFLPNIIIMGRDLFHTQQIASYGIQLAAQHGQMNQIIAEELKMRLENAGIKDYEIYGSPSSEIVQYGQPVEINLVTIVHLLELPEILGFLPSKLKILVKEIEASSVYVRN